VEEELVEEELDKEDEELEEIEVVLEMLEEARNDIKLAHGQVKVQRINIRNTYTTNC
jgi:hypothetical protein